MCAHAVEPDLAGVADRAEVQVDLLGAVRDNDEG